MTTRDNAQRSDTLSLAVQLPRELLNIVACRLARITVDPQVGEEVVLIFTEEPVYADKLAAQHPLKLVAHKSAVETRYGTVGAIVWQIGAGSPAETLVEQYIDPADSGAIKLLEEAAGQSHFKLVVLDNGNSAVRTVLDFPNNFELETLTAAIAGKGATAEGSFAEAMQFAKANARLIDKVRSGTFE